MKKRLLSALLTLGMMLSLLSGAALASAGQRYYTLSLINNITPMQKTGRFAPDTEVTLDAGTMAGYQFLEWEGTEGLHFLDGDAGHSSIRFLMPERNLTLKQIFVPAFQDVPPGAYFHDPVLWAARNGITNGTSDTTFSPYRTCTIAHILTFLWRAAGSPEPTIENPFTDIPEGEYYEKAAVWAYEKGMVSGEEFKNWTPCTRAAAMEYFWILAGSPQSGTMIFRDVDPEAEYAWAVAWAVEHGITTGVTPLTFAPDEICTRGHIVTFLYRWAVR